MIITEFAKCQNLNDFLHSWTGECQSELWTVPSLSQCYKFKLKHTKSGSRCNENTLPLIPDMGSYYYISTLSEIGSEPHILTVGEFDLFNTFYLTPGSNEPTKIVCGLTACDVSLICELSMVFTCEISQQLPIKVEIMYILWNQTI